MELHQLRYVAAIAQAGNFSRAAELCHVSQPSLSQQVQKLEEELGVRLFERMKRHAKPTFHGLAFLKRAESILAEVEAAKSEAEDMEKLLAGTLSIGVLPTIAPYLLPGMVEAFTTRFSGIEIIIQEDTTAQLTRATLARDVDFSIISPPFDTARLEGLTLFTEELLLALPPGHRLAKQRSLSAADLEGESLIVMKEGHCLGDQVLNFCDLRQAAPRVSFRTSQLETIQAMVKAGLGLSLVPEMAVAGATAASPVFRRLAEPRPRREIVAVWPRKRKLCRAAREFLQGVPAFKPPRRQGLSAALPGPDGKREKRQRATG